MNAETELGALKELCRYEYRAHQEWADNPQPRGVCRCFFCRGIEALGLDGFKELGG